MEDQRVQSQEPLITTEVAEENLMLGIEINMKRAFKDAEIQLLRAALGQTKGNVSIAAKLLGINRTTLHEKMKRYRLDEQLNQLN